MSITLVNWESGHLADFGEGIRRQLGSNDSKSSPPGVGFVLGIVGIGIAIGIGHGISISIVKIQKPIPIPIPTPTPI